jgi:hypothetical protein
MPFGIGFEPPAGGVDGDVLADAGHDIVERAPLGRVIEHVVDGNQRDARLAGQRGKPRQAAVVVAAIENARGKPHGFSFDRHGRACPGHPRLPLCAAQGRRRCPQQVRA